MKRALYKKQKVPYCYWCDYREANRCENHRSRCKQYKEFVKHKRLKNEKI